MRIVFDIGAHNGQTLEVLVDHPFDKIHAFEPMPRQVAELRTKFRQPNVHIHPYGLLDRNTVLPVYGHNNNCEASIYSDKVDVDATIETVCPFRNASEFISDNVPDGAELYVKMNCEGAEVPILLSLCESGQIHRITHLTFDLDVRRVPSRAADEQMILARLAEVGFDRYQISSEAFTGITHREKIEGWLASCS
jgi:FkbM family methyltransferase